jgi:hypothetical protein
MKQVKLISFCFLAIVLCVSYFFSLESYAFDECYKYEEGVGEMRDYRKWNNQMFL